MIKSRHVTFRCTQEQYDALKSAAELQHLSFSQFIRQSALISMHQTLKNMGWKPKAFKDKS